jgi:hypothetical protein
MEKDVEKSSDKNTAQKYRKSTQENLGIEKENEK